MVERRGKLHVQAPFRLDLAVWALRRRAHNTVDDWDGTRYRRVLVFEGGPVEVVLRRAPGRSRPNVTVEMQARGTREEHIESSFASARHVLERTLGLGADLDGFYRLAGRDTRLTALADRFRGMRPPCFPSVFEAVVNAVACQQLSLEVGIHLLNRLSARYGPRATTDEDAPRGFPTPQTLARALPEALREMGFSGAKANAIIGVARRVADGDLDLEALREADDEEALETLRSLGGIGRWSAEYVLLRGLGRWHVLPGDDVGARNNLSRRFGLDASAGYDAVAALSRSWWPYGGLVYFHLLLDALAGAGLVAPQVPAYEAAPAALR